MEAAEQAIWEAYLHGRLTPEEQVARAVTLAANPALAAEIEQLRRDLIALETVLRHQQKAELHQLFAESEAQIVRPLWTRLLPYVAAAALAAIVAFTYLFPPQYLSSSRLADRNWTPYDLVTYRAGTEANGPAEQALQAYAAGRYAEVLNLLESLPDSALDSPLQLARGLSQYQTGQLTAAAQTLQSLQADVYLGEAAQWYLALTYLKADDSAAARSLLRIIQQNPVHAWQTEAAQLLEQLPDE